MMDSSKIKPTHTQRAACVYIRQSTPGQVEHNRESTARQYAVIIDEDLGLSGSTTDKRSGFARLTSEVALAHVGIVLGLEVSRLARNNADWYRLLELCGVTDTLIGDNDGVYHPALFNDRLLLGLKGTMSEAELHIIRARLDGGIRNKAARGELRRGLPVVCRSRCRRCPLACRGRSAGSLRPTTHSIKSSRIRCMLALTPWSVLIRDHHPGFIDWATFEAHQARLDSHCCRAWALAATVAAACMFIIAAATRLRITAPAKTSSTDAACTVSMSAEW